MSPTLKARKPKSGVVVPNEPVWYQRLGAFLIFFLANIYGMTLRIRWSNHSGFSPSDIKTPAIFCLWHNRLILCMEVYRTRSRRITRGDGLAALISASKDGAFLAAILDRFGVEAVRGSSSRRGPQALLELTSWAERGYDLAITPDGPRGPRYIVQEGVMSLAQLTGLPIIPFSFHAHRKICVKSWDQFQIPLPFSRCDLSIGHPISIPREATDAERETLRRQLEDSLKNLSGD